jgi:protein subunit release factor A
MIDRVREFLRHYKDLEAQLSSPEVAGNPSKMEKLGREYNSLRKNISIFNEYAAAFESREQATNMLKTESDPELAVMAEE